MTDINYTYNFCYNLDKNFIRQFMYIDYAHKGSTWIQILNVEKINWIQKWKTEEEKNQVHLCYRGAGLVRRAARGPLVHRALAALGANVRRIRIAGELLRAHRGAFPRVESRRRTIRELLVHGWKTPSLSLLQFFIRNESDTILSETKTASVLW